MVSHQALWNTYFPRLIENKDKGIILLKELQKVK